jgi:hypothetical protein
MAVTTAVDGEDGVGKLAWLVVATMILVASARVEMTSSEDDTTEELAGIEEVAAALLAVTTEPEGTADEVTFAPAASGISVTVVKAVILLVSVTLETTRTRTPTVVYYIRV